MASGGGSGMTGGHAPRVGAGASEASYRVTGNGNGGVKSGVTSGFAGASGATASAAADNNYNNDSNPGYEFLNREMQYMLKFVDPDQNVASMDELIQSGVDLLDLLPPEEGGVKPRFSNPSNDWKYDIIAKSLDACNPVSECTCYHYDDRKQDIHLCSVHHDTVSQDSDTLTMDTEGSLVHLPTIKLQPSGAALPSSSTSSITSSVTISNSSTSSGSNVQDVSLLMKQSDDLTGGAAYREAGSRTDADHTPVAQDSALPSNENTPTHSNHHPPHQHDVTTDDAGQPVDRETSATKNGGSAGDASRDAETSEGNKRNSTVFAEVHVDATNLKYDDTSATNVQKQQQQNPAGPPGANPGAEDATNAHPTHNHNPAGGVSAGANNQQATTAAASINSNAQQQQQQQQQQQNPTTNTSLGDEFTNLKKKPKLMEKCPSNPLPDHTTVTTAAAPSSEASTSKQKSNFEMFLSRPMDTTAHEHRKKALKKRPSLPIEPRTTQYQKHALLQERSDTGVLEFELMLAERLQQAEAEAEAEAATTRGRHHLTNRKCSLDSSRLKLTPRTNQYEPHPLLRKTNSGMSEIEEVLQEKEQEFIRKMEEKRNSAAGLENTNKPDPKKFVMHRGSLGRLEPRLGQYEKHSLLQSKDEEGRTVLEMFLEEEMLERKASMTDSETVIYSDKEKLAPRKSNTSDKDTSSNKGSIKKVKSLKTSSIKKVHFERSGSKDKKNKEKTTEEPESGISSKGEPSSITSDPAKTPPEGQGQTEGHGQGHEADNGYDTDDDDKTEEDRLTGERAKAKLKQDQRKCCTIL